MRARTSPPVTEQDKNWCVMRFSMMRDGGVWAVPRSGLIFTRRGLELVLTARMPWTEAIAEAAEAGRDVPANAGALVSYQRADYELIRSRFEAAGIPVRSELDDG